MDAYIRAVAFLSRVAGVVAAFLIFFAVLVICDIVVERYILNLTTIWQIDVVTYCIVGATFVGSAYVLMTRGHVNVDILPLHVKPRTRFWLALATSFAVAGLLHRYFCSLHGLLVRGLSRIGGCRTPCGGHGFGFRISRCRSGSACSSCNMWPISCAL